MSDNSNGHPSDVMIDHKKFNWSELYRNKDYWAIWLGFLLILVGLFAFLNNPPKNMEAKIARANAEQHFTLSP